MNTERIKVTITAETDKAWQVLYFGMEAWIAKSLVDKMIKKGNDAEMVIPHWLFKKKFEYDL